MAEYYLDQGVYPAYSATPSWGVCEEGDGKFGSGATGLTATISGGAVTGITFTNGGSGYGSGTLVKFTGGGGTSAAATAVVNSTGVIQSFTIDAGGSGYSTAPTVTLCPGKAKAAIASVVLDEQPTANDTLVVMGVTFTAVASGATGNQFNIGASIAATCDNIAAALNGTSPSNASQTVVGTGISVSQHQLRNMIYARGPTNGAPTATVQIMHRAGSYDLNHAANTNVAITKTGVWTPTITNFIGGESGVWGYLTNPSGTIWPSGVALRSYGASVVATTQAPLMVKTTRTEADTIHVRSNGHSILIDRASSATMPAWTGNGNFLWDDGTVWTGDTGVFSLTLRDSGAAAANWNITGASFLTFASRSKYNLRVIADGTGSAGTLSFNIGSSGSRIAVKRVWYTDEGLGTGPMKTPTTGSNCSVVMEGCKGTYKRNAWYAPFFTGGNYGSQSLQVNDFYGEWTTFSGTPGYLIDLSTPTSDGNVYEFTDSKFVTINPGLDVANVSATPFIRNQNCRLVVRNVEGVRIPPSSYSAIGSASGTPSLLERGNGAFFQNVGSDRAFRTETVQFLVEWMPGSGFPVCDSYLPNGTAWSYRVVWASATLYAINQSRPVEVISLTKTNILAAGNKTIAMELKVDDNYDHLMTYSHLMLQIVYQANDGTGMKVERTPFTDTVVPSSSKTWTDSAGSYNGTHVARKLEITTATSVKQNTEVEARLILLAEPANTQSFFVNPELTITAA